MYLTEFYKYNNIISLAILLNAFYRKPSYICIEQYKAKIAILIYHSS